MDELANKLGSRIRALRKERGLTLEQLAYAGEAVRSKGYLSDIEQGKRRPSLDVVEALAKELGVEVLDLFVWPEQSARHQQIEVARLKRR